MCIPGCTWAGVCVSQHAPGMRGCVDREGCAQRGCVFWVIFTDFSSMFKIFLTGKCLPIFTGFPVQSRNLVLTFMNY